MKTKNISVWLLDTDYKLSKKELLLRVAELREKLAMARGELMSIKFNIIADIDQILNETKD